MPLFYESFLNGLTQYGNDVFVASCNKWVLNYDKIPEKILKKIKNFNPDLIILFNNCLLPVL